jgi:hypothetical protein
MNATTQAAHVPHTAVLLVLRQGANAIRSRSRSKLVSAWSALSAQLDRRLYGSERYRVVRMMQGIERRMSASGPGGAL